jgi:hypothetical protein
MTTTKRKRKRRKSQSLNTVTEQRNDVNRRLMKMRTTSHN